MLQTFRRLFVISALEFMGERRCCSGSRCSLLISLLSQYLWILVELDKYWTKEQKIPITILILKRGSCLVHCWSQGEYQWVYDTGGSSRPHWSRKVNIGESHSPSGGAVQRKGWSFDVQQTIWMTSHPLMVESRFSWTVWTRRYWVCSNWGDRSR